MIFSELFHTTKGMSYCDYKKGLHLLETDVALQ